MGERNTLSQNGFAFNLFNNPFVFLGIDPAASNNEILDAVEDAIADNSSHEAEINSAKQTLLNPRSRIEAELSALIDTPSGESRSIISRLRAGQNYNDLRQSISRLAPLSRSNILTHLSSRSGPNPDMLVSFVDARAEVDVAEIVATLDRVRKSAGIVKPDPDLVRNNLYQLSEKQVQSIFGGYPDTTSAAIDAKECITRILFQPDTKQIDALEALLRGYRHRADPDLFHHRQEIEATFDALKNDPDNPNSLHKLIAELKEWEKFGRPLQLLEAHKGRDEPEARSLYQSIRSLSIDLANNHGKFDVSLKISRVSAEIFSDLPRAASELAEDIATLEERAAFSQTDALLEFIKEVSGKLNWLAGDLRKHGFAATSRGLSGELFSSFNHAVSRTKGTVAAQAPYILLRNLAIKLNNDENEAVAALALVDGVLSFGGEHLPADGVLKALREDRNAVERNVLEHSLMEHIKNNRSSQALAAIDRLLPSAKTNDERDFLRGIKQKIERKRIGSYVKWAFWGGIGLLVIVGILSDNKPSYVPPPSSSYRPSPSPSQPTYAPSQPSYQPAPVSPPAPQYPPQDVTEVMPPVGSGLDFTRNNVRYCAFQRERLEFARSLTSDNFAINGFNRAVDDWNSRCASYRYRSADKSAVEIELSGARSRLQEQARQLVAQWAAGRGRY